MNKIPLNQEHLEALQYNTNKSRDQFVNSLNEEDKQKFKAVEEAVNILVKNKVWFYLFPMLKGEQNGNIADFVWQWNSILHFMEYSNNGQITEESIAKNKHFNKLMLDQWNYIYSKMIHTK